MLIDVNPNPIANFISDSVICGNESINFVDNSFGRSLKYNWYFDSLAVIKNYDSVGPINNKFNDTGTYKITLNVESSDGCSDDTTRNLIVLDLI